MSDFKLDRDWDNVTIRYPEPAVEILDPRFKKYVNTNACIERICTGMRWAEGPAWFGDGRYLLWSDIPNNRQMRWCEESGEVSVFRSPSNYSNGNTRDRQGRLLSCEHGTRRVTRTEHDGTITVLMDSYDGKQLNAPNDIVVHPDDHVWYTDPGYGTLLNYEGNKGVLELPANVYRLNPETGEATVATGELDKPNGLCFSPDNSKLYVSDTGITHNPDCPRVIYVFDVVDNSRLENKRVFCDMGEGLSDGFRCDIDGNIWTSAGWAGEGYDGVHIFTPEGDLIGKIHLPEICANICFGGVKRNRLFMAGSQSIYSLYVETQGATLT
ncbi:MAG: SMP-30/gluconolactonase/LRE family protein [Lentisphaeria bacterium]|nr:SMP-30/gluconolactonase/LRE family protein [Lentisphaeria bacterium]